MDFSQPSKINSGFHPRSQQQRQLQNKFHSNFSQNRIQSKFLPSQQRSVRDTQRYIPAPSVMYEELELAAPSNSFCGDSLMKEPNDCRYMQKQEPVTLPDRDGHGIEYFQYTPSLSTPHRDQNSFKHVMDSMQQFSRSKINDHTSCPNIGRNHQTFCFKHFDDNEEVVTKNTQKNKTYQSHTTIEKFPKGLKIITEIFTDDSEDDCKATPEEDFEKREEDCCVNYERKAFEECAGDESD